MTNEAMRAVSCDVYYFGPCISPPFRLRVGGLSGEVRGRRRSRSRPE
jgi:hypothetical protein